MALLGRAPTQRGGGLEERALTVAVQALAIAQAQEERAEDQGEIGAVEGWIAEYLDPVSQRALPGAKGLWVKCVNAQRDASRRARAKTRGGQSRIVLSMRHRLMLEEIARSRPGKSASQIVAGLIEAQHRKTVSKADDGSRQGDLGV